MLLALFTTVLTLSALYAPQPLLPVFVREFGVSREAAAFLTTVAFFPLSLAPLAYGYLLESVSPRRLLRGAVLLLALSEILFFLAGSFPLLVGLRLAQGMLIPAILTALMTYLSQITRPAAVPRAMALYVASTILGGFLGRACSGLVASWLGWRYSFLALAVSLVLCFFLLGRLAGETVVRLARPTPATVLKVLRRPSFLRVYLTVFSLFLAFAAVMNFLPFRLTEISDRADEFRIGLMYTGYVMGIATSLGAVRVATFLGGERRAMILGLILFTASLFGLATDRVELLFADMFLFCGAMFLVHAIASGLLNRQAAENKGMVNGLYVAFYYAGGTVGSYLPGFLYLSFGWPAFLLSLALVSLLGLAAAWKLSAEC